MSSLYARARSYGKACLILLVFGLILIYASAAPGGALGFYGELVGSIMFLAGLGLMIFILWVAMLWVGRHLFKILRMLLEAIFIHGYTSEPQE